MKTFTACPMVLTLTMIAAAGATNLASMRGARSVGGLGTHGVGGQHKVIPMLTGADAMLAELARMGRKGAPVSSVKQLVDIVEPFIKTLEDSIKEQHTAAQNTLDVFGNNSTGCDTALSDGEAEARSLEAQVATLSDNHSDCRSKEGSANTSYTACMTAYTALEGTKNAECAALAAETHEAIWAKIKEVDSISGESWGSYLGRCKDELADRHAKYLVLQEKCDNATAKFNAQSVVCFGADGNSGEKKAFNDKLAECNGLQTSLESTACSSDLKNFTTCSSYNTCAGVLWQQYDNQIGSIKDQEAERKKEWHTADQIRCILKKFANATSSDPIDVNSCTGMQQNTSHLTLVYPAVKQTPPTCPDVRSNTCGADYLSKHYGNLPANAPAAACQSCAVPVVTPVGCSAAATSAGSYTDLEFCKGTWVDPGLLAGQAALCAVGWELCNVAQISTSGLTKAQCTSVTGFYAAGVSQQHAGCEQEGIRKKPGRNDIWGCGNAALVKNADCGGVLDGTIGNEDCCGGWKGLKTPPGYDTEVEKAVFKGTQGGVMCCKA